MQTPEPETEQQPEVTIVAEPPSDHQNQKGKPMQSPEEIAAQVMRGQGSGMFDAMAAILEIKREATLQEKMLEQVERKMNVRQRLADGVADTVTAEDEAQEAKHRAEMNALRRKRELEAARNPAPAPYMSEPFNRPPRPRPSWMPASDADLKRKAREACIEICKEPDPLLAWEGFRKDLQAHDMAPRLREELEELVRERLQALDVL